MGKALLINPSSLLTYGTDRAGTVAFPLYPVLGLASIAGAIVERGHEVEILDLSYVPYDGREVARSIERSAPDIVAITATTPLANQMRDMSYIVKSVAPDAISIAGGPHPSALPVQTMQQSQLDLVAVGEADFVVADLLDGHAPAGMPGLVHRAGAGVVENPAGPLLDNLDLLPMPAWDHYPTALATRMSSVIARHQPVTTIEFSRGCVFRCDFCASKQTMGYGYRKKSPERCAEEMVRLGRLGFKEVILTDDIFTSDGEWAAQVCEAIIRADPGVAWTCSNGIRVDSCDRDLFTLMRRAGCYRVCFGFESGNDAVLRSFGKGGRASLHQGVEAAGQAKRAGLEADGLFMVGLSADTEETLAETIEFARSVPLDIVKCGICVPFPGTDYFAELHAAGRIRSYDWDGYSVWNQADRIYEHPNLPWESIRAAFHEFYTQIYLRNPSYVVRRAIVQLREGGLLENLRFVRQGWRAMRNGRQLPDPNSYVHEQLWRPLDLTVESEIETRPPPRAVAFGGPQSRDGQVKLSVSVTPVRAPG